MKSKNPAGFWLRWMGVSTLHAVIFSALWILNPSFFVQWQWAFIPLNFIFGIALIVLQYWAMSPMMRPSPKRWFPASILGVALSVSLHGMFWFIMRDNALVGDYLNLYKIGLLGSIFLPQAIAKSWALSERFKQSWLFALAFCMPALMYIGQITIRSQEQIFLMEMLFWILRAAFLGLSLNYLQKYQSKESSAFSASHERLEMPEESEDFEAETALLQQKMR